jgi:hypothetical protein
MRLFKLFCIASGIHFILFAILFSLSGSVTIGCFDGGCGSLLDIAMIAMDVSLFPVVRPISQWLPWSHAFLGIFIILNSALWGALVVLIVDLWKRLRNRSKD